MHSEGQFSEGGCANDCRRLPKMPTGQNLKIGALEAKF
jgi:hypothetical protein